MSVCCLSQKLQGTNSNCSGRSLSEEYALGFDDKEVDQLLNVVQCSFERLLGDCVVAAWADGSSETSTQNKFSSQLSSGSD